MRAYSKGLRYTILSLIVAISLFVAGCTIDDGGTLGSNIMPNDQVMEMRHLKFKGNTIVRLNAETGTNEAVPSGEVFIETRQYRSDSVLASNTGKGYMGVRRSEIFGNRTAGFASSILYMNALDSVNGFGYMPIFDTMKLVLSVTDYGGDTLVPIRYKVFELKKPLAGNVLVYDAKRDEDSVAYINCDLSGVYDESKPIFEFTFPQSDLGEGPATIMVPMENTAHSWDFARRLMLVPDNYDASGSDWDGYGRTNLEIYSDDEKWANSFYGLYIKPDLDNTPANKEGAIYALDLSASGIMLQGRSRNPKDPTMIKDTVGMYYYFVDSDSKYNTAVNKIEHDYSHSILREEDMSEMKSRDERKLVSTCYVEGLGGPALEIYLTDAFLNKLVSLATENDTFTKMGINQCLMQIYIAGATYDWSVTQNNASNLVERLNKSFTRLGAYLDYKTLSPIIDYDYVYESSYSAESVYGGYLDRSRGCYEMNITAHIQRLFAEMRQSDGTFDISKADEKFRTIYIGTEATAPYSFSECALQGMEDKSSVNEAPIQIDLTYTLIK